MKGRSTKTPCALEIESGIIPVHRLNMCTGLSFNNETNEKEVNCKECPKYIYGGIRKKVFNIICLVIAVFVLLIIATPQGAIRRNLLVTSGIDAAVSATVYKKENIRKGAFPIDIYIVSINGIEETWAVKYISINCYATKIELDNQELTE